MPSAKIDLTTTGDLIAAHASPTAFIRVHGFTVSADGAGTGRFEDDDGVVYSGLASAAGSNATSADYTELGHFDLPAGKKLQFVVAGGSPRFLGHVAYSYRNVPLGV